MDNLNYVCPYNNHFNNNTSFIGDENGEPFVVQASTDSWIPVSVIIFAKDEDDALKRVKEGLEFIALNQSKRPEHYINSYDKAQRTLDTCEFFCKPFDKRYLAKAVWAGNDYLG